MDIKRLTSRASKTKAKAPNGCYVSPNIERNVDILIRWGLKIPSPFWNNRIYEPKRFLTGVTLLVVGEINCLNRSVFGPFIGALTLTVLATFTLDSLRRAREFRFCILTIFKQGKSRLNGSTRQT